MPFLNLRQSFWGGEQVKNMVHFRAVNGHCSACPVGSGFRELKYTQNMRSAYFFRTHFTFLYFTFFLAKRRVFQLFFALFANSISVISRTFNIFPAHICPFPQFFLLPFTIFGPIALILGVIFGQLWARFELFCTVGHVWANLISKVLRFPKILQSKNLWIQQNMA